MKPGTYRLVISTSYLSCPNITFEIEMIIKNVLCFVPVEQVRPYPRKAFAGEEGSLTLNDLGLTSKQEALFLELI